MSGFTLQLTHAVDMVTFWFQRQLKLSSNTF